MKDAVVPAACEDDDEDGGGPLLQALIAGLAAAPYCGRASPSFSMMAFSFLTVSAANFAYCSLFM